MQEAKSVYLCPVCHGYTIITPLEDDSFQIKCTKGHINIINPENCSEYFKKMTDIPNKCNLCNKKKAIIYCVDEKKMLCQDCEKTHKKQHKVLNVKDIHSHCHRHLREFFCFCETHSENLCMECMNEHKSCKIINFTDIIPPLEDIRNLEKMLEEKEKELKKEDEKIKEISDLLNRAITVKDNSIALKTFYETVLKTYQKNKNNYTLIQNIKELIASENLPQINFEGSPEYKKLKSVLDPDSEKSTEEKFEANISEIPKVDESLTEMTINTEQKEEFKDPETTNDDFAEITLTLRVIDRIEIIRPYTWGPIVIMDNLGKPTNIIGNDYKGETGDTMIVDGVETSFSKTYTFNILGEHTVKLKIQNNQESYKYLFKNCFHIVKFDLQNLKTDNTEDMEEMFLNCNSFKTIDLSSFRTSKVKTMKAMFQRCYKATELAFPSFDTRNVEDMGWMFDNNLNLTKLDISNFKTPNLENILYIFNHCESLTELKLGSFNPEKAPTLTALFAGMESIKEINMSGFNTSMNTSLQSTFSGCKKLEKIIFPPNMDTRKMTTFYNAFERCEAIKVLDLSNFYCDSLSSMSFMFSDCASLEEIYMDKFSAKKFNKDSFRNTFYGTKNLKKIRSNRDFIDAIKNSKDSSRLSENVKFVEV